MVQMVFLSGRGRLRCSSTPPRNLSIVDGSCCLGNPQIKQLNGGNFPASWALPGDVGLSLLIYLGVFRPVEIKLASQMKQMQGSDLEEMKHYIFIKP